MPASMNIDSACKVQEWLDIGAMLNEVEIMATYRFTIPGPPTAKGRPRFARRGIKAITFTPDKTRAWEKDAKIILKAGMKGNPPLEGPVCAEICFSMPKPKKLKRKHHTIKPDIDNFIKSAFDAMNGIVFVDDAQIVMLAARKEYSDDPCVMINVSKIED